MIHRLMKNNKNCNHPPQKTLFSTSKFLLFSCFLSFCLTAPLCATEKSYDTYRSDRRNADVIGPQFVTEKIDAYKKALSHLSISTPLEGLPAKTLQNFATAYREVAEIIYEMCRATSDISLAQEYARHSMRFLLKYMGLKGEKVDEDHLEFAKKTAFFALKVNGDDCESVNAWIAAYGTYVENWLEQSGKKTSEKYKTALGLMENVGDYLEVDPELQNIYYDKYLDYLTNSFDNPHTLLAEDLFKLACTCYELVLKMNNVERKVSAYSKGQNHLHGLFTLIASQTSKETLQVFTQRCLKLPCFVQIEEIKATHSLAIALYSATAATLCSNPKQEAEYWEQMAVHLLKAAQVLPHPFWAPPALYRIVANGFHKSGKRPQSQALEEQACTLEEIYRKNLVPGISLLMENKLDGTFMECLAQCSDLVGPSLQDLHPLERNTSSEDSSKVKTKDTSKSKSSSTESEEQTKLIAITPDLDVDPLESELNEASNIEHAKPMQKLGDEMRLAAEKAQNGGSGDPEEYRYYIKLYKSAGQYYGDAIHVLRSSVPPSLYLDRFTAYQRLYSTACTLTKLLKEPDHELEKLKSASLRVASDCIRNALERLKDNATEEHFNNGYETLKIRIEGANKNENIWPLFEKALTYHEGYLHRSFNSQGRLLDASSWLRFGKEYQRRAEEVCPFHEGSLLKGKDPLVHTYVFYLALSSRYTELGVKGLSRNANPKDFEAAALAHLQEYEAIEKAGRAGFGAYLPENSNMVRCRLLEGYLSNAKNKDKIESGLLDVKSKTINLVAEFLSHVCEVDDNISNRFLLVDFLAREARSIHDPAARYNVFTKACSEGILLLKNCAEDLNDEASKFIVTIDNESVEKDFSWLCHYVASIFLESIKCAADPDEGQGRCVMITNLLNDYGIFILPPPQADTDELMDIDISRLSLIKYVLDQPRNGPKHISSSGPTQKSVSPKKSKLGRSKDKHPHGKSSDSPNKIGALGAPKRPTSNPDIPALDTLTGQAQASGQSTRPTHLVRLRSDNNLSKTGAKETKKSPRGKIGLGKTLANLAKRKSQGTSGDSDDQLKPDGRGKSPRDPNAAGKDTLQKK